MMVWLLQMYDQAKSIIRKNLNPKTPPEYDTHKPQKSRYWNLAWFSNYSSWTKNMKKVLDYINATLFKIWILMGIPQDLDEEQVILKWGEILYISNNLSELGD